MNIYTFFMPRLMALTKMKLSRHTDRHSQTNNQNNKRNVRSTLEITTLRAHLLVEMILDILFISVLIVDLRKKYISGVYVIEIT